MHTDKQTDKNDEANRCFLPLMQTCLNTITVNATLSLCSFDKSEHSEMKCKTHTTAQCAR
jgi:hypothetical protein